MTSRDYSRDFFSRYFFSRHSDTNPMIIGLEWNMNSPENFAGGLALGMDWNLPVAPLAVGINVTGSDNFSGVSVLELSALLRWYPAIGHGENRRDGPFVQANLGGSLIRAEMDAPFGLLAELRGGFRQPMGTSLFIEPYARLGFPVMLGVGVLGGIRLLPSGRRGPAIADNDTPEGMAANRRIEITILED